MSQLQESQKDDWPQAMALVSDSRGMGLLANTSLGQSISLRNKIKLDLIARVLDDAAENFQTTGKRSATSRRISEETYQEDDKAANRNLNAFTGNQSYSHRKRFEKAAKRKIHTYNVSIGAAISQHAEDMIDYARKLAGDQISIDYWVFDIGAVDYMIGKPVEEFKANIHEALKHLFRLQPEARVLIVSLPDIPRLLTFPEENAYKILGKEKWGESCFDVQNRVLNLDQSVRLIQEENLKTMIMGYNRALRDLAESFSDKFKINFTALPKGGDMRRGLSADCWHPGKLGNKIISNATWSDALDLIRTTKN